MNAGHPPSSPLARGLLAIGLVFGGICIGYLLRGRGLAKALRRDEPPRILAAPTRTDCYFLLVLGQSNAANHGEPRGKAGPGARAFHEGAFYECTDPMPGASGPGGSPWPRFAALRHLKDGARITAVATLAQGSSRCRDWAPGGEHHPRIESAIRSAGARGFTPDVVLWLQGETESWEGGDPAAYARDMARVINGLRALGVKAPVFVCLATRDGRGVVNAGIRQAQASVWNATEGVFAGVDADSLGEEFRHDGIHFNERGLTMFATLLEEALAGRSDKAAATWRGNTR